jgi:transcriptional regulator with XRE-family HTH domain/DNA-directed RNA polymerase specialized sigma24 family protein
MSAQQQHLPILGRIDLMPPSTITFKGIPRNQPESIEEAVASDNLERIAAAMSNYLSNLYPTAPYLQGAKGGNYELTNAVIMKYWRSRPDWEPTPELPALKPTITSHKLIRHWLRMTAKRTHIDLCRGYNAHRKHYVLASDLIPAGAESFDSLEWAQGLQWGGAESSSEVKLSSECEVGNSRLASFYSLKDDNKKTGKDDWCKSYLRLDKEHPYNHPVIAIMDKLKELEIPVGEAVFTESCRSWTRLVPVPTRLDPYAMMRRRNALDLSEEQLATACGLSVEKIQDAEDGYKVSPTRLKIIARALGTTVEAIAKGDMILAPLNNPLKASSASAPYSKGQRYPFFREEAIVILGQAMSKLTAEERGRIRAGWSDSSYCPDYRKIVNRLKKLCAPRTKCIMHERAGKSLTPSSSAGGGGSAWAFEQFCELIDSPRGLMALYDEWAGWSSPIILAERTPTQIFPFRLVAYHPRNTTIPVIEVSEPIQNDFRLFFPSADRDIRSHIYYRYRGADVEILEDGSGDLRLVRFVCGERANLWVPADELIAPKKKVSKRTQQVSQMYKCGERGCSCKPVHKYLKDKLACNDKNCKCRVAYPPYTGPAPQDDRERWLVSIGLSADWKRPEYLGRK